MVNLKYPAGLKQKGPMAWLGGLAFTVAPLFFLWDEHLSSESKNGVAYGPNATKHFYWIGFINSDFRHNVQYRELLNLNPNYKVSYLDSRRLRFDELSSSSTPIL